MAHHKQESYALINATLLDGSEGMEPQANMAVITDGQKISWVGPSTCAHVPAGTSTIDLAGAYLMPGLINMHVHLCGSGKPISSGNAGSIMGKLDNPVGHLVIKKILSGSAQQQLASGVTTIRDAGDPLYGDLMARDAVESGRMEGPRIVAAGTGITVPSGHGAGLFAQVANSPAEAAAMVRDLFARNVDVIKLFITGGVFDATVAGEPGVVKMSLEMASAACAEAHRLNLPVMAHVESTEGVRLALAAGVDTVEHGAAMDDQILELYRGSARTQLPGRAPSVTCTISPALPFCKLPPEKTRSTEVQKINGDIVCDGIVRSAKQALAAGIPVGLGTDSSCPYVTQYDMWRELAYFAKYVGASNAFALHTATQVNARLLGLGDVCGAVAAGYDADLIVCEKNPLDDLSALRDVSRVFARGHLVRRARVKHLAELDAELDAIMAMPA
ncbi:amidohydrolase family protein [Paratractidigestivibacter sp.]|uniref:amidohydrolase family protein n=1 Tax=Paratractidigestivibacter sp. TaxID=2847316 RepID=UPI002ABDA02B|nr:amidohydrolase family protein [Paratractidigestivibacter sp.]